MRLFAAALGMTLCTTTLAFSQSPPAQQPGAKPGEVVAPTEGLPTQGTASAATPVPGHVDVHFADASAAIAQDEQANIARLAALCGQGQASMIALAGYPDAPGDPRQAIHLAFLRASAVMEALLAEGKVSKFGWDISAVVTPDQHRGEDHNVVGTCK
jgi:outer membrane protein OmpA-like peptidoglycan-associated protein